MKIKLIFLGIVIALILIIVLSVCHGFKCHYGAEHRVKVEDVVRFFSAESAPYQALLPSRGRAESQGGGRCALLLSSISGSSARLPHTVLLHHLPALGKKPNYSCHRLCREETLGKSLSAHLGRQKALCREPKEILSGKMCQEPNIPLVKDEVTA
jgi:hypothetical protein